MTREPATDRPFPAGAFDPPVLDAVERLLGVERSSGRERWAVARGAAEAMGKPLPRRPG